MQTRVAIFFGLNAVRFFSLVGLILVFASSIVVLVDDIHAIQRSSQPQIIDSSNATAEVYEECLDYLEGSTVPNQAAGAFWAIVNRFLIIFEIIFLFLSEVGWPSKFFATYFPVLGPDFGVGALGVFECLIGAAILSHHVNQFALVSAFFLFSIGCLNILAGLIFRESSRPRRSLTEWKDSKAPTLPTTIIPRDQLASGASSFISNAEKPYSIPIHAAHPTETSATPIHGENATESRNYGWGRQAGFNEKSGLKGFLISRPLESVPPYAARPGVAKEPEQYQSGGSAV